MSETRRLIDAQLRAAGWEVDSEQLTYGNGIRPQKGKNLAIAEWPYSYKEAVIDGHLIDCEPPIRITTALSEDGIMWQAGEAMEYYDPITGRIDLVHAPDEVKIEVEQFNRQVITEEFNRVICEFLAANIDPSLPGKTLIFCVKDDHADIVVNLLKQALIDQYGSVEDDAVLKITGKADQPSQLIRRFQNEANPKIAVTVDLLSTGIDVP